MMVRRANLRDMAPLTVAATMDAAFFFVLLDGRDTLRLVPESARLGLQVFGTAWQFSAKFFLGRSFGPLPAQRGLVLNGRIAW